MKKLILCITIACACSFVFCQTSYNSNKRYEQNEDNPKDGAESKTKPEVYDWYTSINTIRVHTADENFASVSVQVALGYKRNDELVKTEIANHRIEIIDALRSYFSERTVSDFKPQNVKILRQNVKDLLNNKILENARIADVQFITLDVVQQ